MTQSDIIKTLEKEIKRTDRKTERECGSLLKEIAAILLPSIDQTITFADAEVNNSAGRTDLIIIGDAVQTSGETTRREAYLWELKAPQVYLFEIDTNCRANPTKELYDAEHQLLHYHNSTAYDESFRKKWNILSSDQVKFGGIIIGYFPSNFVKLNGMQELKAKALAQVATDIRDRYFYKPNHIKLHTWDSIILIARKLLGSHQWKQGDPSTTISVEATSPISLD